MDFIEFIIEQNLQVVPALWILGTFLKRSPNVKDWVIPWVILLVGVSATVTMKLEIPLVESVIQGVLVAGAAILVHQLLKQTVNKE